MEQPRRYTFRIGDIFSSNDQVALFLVSFQAGLNDLLYVNRLLVPDDNYGLLKGEPTAAENAYLLRLSAGHVFEIVRLLEEVDEIPTVKEFLDGLPAEAQRQRRDVKQLAGPGSKLRPTLALTRNNSWHSPKPTDQRFRRIVKDRANMEGVLEVGNKMPSIRGHFADEILVGLLTFHTRDSEVAFAKLMQSLGEVTWKLVHLAQHALGAHLLLHADETEPTWPN